DGAVESLRGLMTAHHRWLRLAVGVETIDLPSGDRSRHTLVADIVDPGKCRSGGGKLLPVLIGNHHHRSGPLEIRDGEAGMGRVWIDGRGIEAADEFRPRQIADVEDEEAVMPIADIQTPALTQRMMTTGWRKIIPGIWFSSGLPLTWNPPTPNLLGPRRI